VLWEWLTVRDRRIGRPSVTLLSPLTTRLSNSDCRRFAREFLRLSRFRTIGLRPFPSRLSRLSLGLGPFPSRLSRLSLGLRSFPSRLSRLLLGLGPFPSRLSRLSLPLRALSAHFVSLSISLIPKIKILITDIVDLINLMSYNDKIISDRSDRKYTDHIVDIHNTLQTFRYST
jgi:hypothetical protein